MRHPRYWAKDVIMGTLMALGESSSLRFNVVLLYHSVGSDVPWAVSKDQFRRQLALVKSRYQVVTLREMHRLSTEQGSAEGKPLLSITFDDGALDNYTHALPALEEAGLKATFFIVTGCLGGAYKGSYYETPAMDRAKVKEVFACGHEIGSHTVSHPHLTQIPRQDVITEMRGSKNYLEDLTSDAVTSFCYPFGDCNREVRDCAQEVGYASATNTHEALCPVSSVDWLMVPRVGVDNTVGTLQFRAKISGALERYERLRGRRPERNHGELSPEKR